MITSLPTCAPPRPPKKNGNHFPGVFAQSRGARPAFQFFDAPHPAQARPPHDLFSRSAVFSPAARHQREAPASNNRSPPGSSPGSVFSSAPPSAESPAGSRVRAMPCPFRRPSHCPGSTRTSPRLGSAPLPTSSPRQPFLRPSFSAPPADKKSAAPASENSDQERRSLLTVTLR